MKVNDIVSELDNLAPLVKGLINIKLNNTKSLVHNPDIQKLMEGDSSKTGVE